MIKEFAIEPNVINNWRDCRYFLDQMGVCKGRVLSEYPENWKKLVFESLAGCKPKEKSRIVEYLRTLAPPTLYRRKRAYWDDGRPWLMNAISEHQINPFHAIISNEMTDEEHNVIEAESCTTSSAPKWQIETSQRVERNPEKMANSIDWLLLHSRHIILIDRNFHFDRWTNPLVEILKRIGQSRNVVLVEYHISLHEHMQESYFMSEIRRRVERYVPRYCKLEFVNRERKELHDRYVLTDVGAVQFGIGLDEYIEHLDQPTHDVIVLLGDKLKEELWEEHVGKTPFISIEG